MMKLAQGDPVAAQSLLEQVPPEYDPDGWIWDIRIKTVLYLRDYDAANRVVAANPAEFADNALAGGEVRIGLMDRLRVRAAIIRRRWQRLQPRARKWKPNRATNPRMRLLRGRCKT